MINPTNQMVRVQFLSKESTVWVGGLSASCTVYEVQDILRNTWTIGRHSQYVFPSYLLRIFSQPFPFYHYFTAQLFHFYFRSIFLFPCCPVPIQRQLLKTFAVYNYQNAIPSLYFPFSSCRPIVRIPKYGTDQKKINFVLL